MLATQLDSNAVSFPEAKPSGSNKQHWQFIYLYLAFGAAASLVWQSYEGLGLSTCITTSAAFQLLAYSMLALKVVQQQSVRGISGKALMCYSAVYASRLSSTTWLLGYLPSDSTGDGLYQLLDAMSLLTVLSLLYFIFKKYRLTYQEDQDTFSIGPLVAACFFGAIVLHPDLNDRPIWDTMWTFALYMDVFAMMPQLWMIAKCENGKLDAMSAHYIAAISASRLVYLFFWLHAFPEFAPEDGSFNWCGWSIMLAGVIQCLLLADFVYMYVKACMVKCGQNAGCLRDKPTGQSVQTKVDTSALVDI